MSIAILEPEQRNPSRSNAFTMLKNGNSGFGTTTPDVKVDVDGAIAPRPSAAIPLTAAITNLDPSHDNRSTYLLNPDGSPPPVK